jgi:hypothetical protein
MSGPDIRSAQGVPRDGVAQLVEVADDLVESESQVPSDVLKDAEHGTQDRDSLGHIGPEVPCVIGPLACAGV